jgi:hypothetical protein
VDLLRQPGRVGKKPLLPRRVGQPVWEDRLAVRLAVDGQGLTS